MQFTFSLDQPSPVSSNPAPVKKLDLKPSAEFKDSSHRGRGRLRPHSVRRPRRGPSSHPAGPQALRHTDVGQPEIDDYNVSPRFPSLFNNNFSPSALLYSSPSVTNGMTYGEGVRGNSGSDFSILRPTIEPPLRRSSSLRIVPILGVAYFLRAEQLSAT